ncbi:MAG TPA: hypothetical protein VFL04_00480, partial [Rectinemataceae bacterium]|nr:hypothetical protein [Rectinemataceae bacterium]
RVVREIEGMLETAAALAMNRPTSLASLGGHHGATALSGTGATAMAVDETGHPILPPILKTVAASGEGMAELAAAIRTHRADMAASGRLEARRLEGAVSEMRGLIAYRLLDALEGPKGRELEARLARAVVDREYDAYEAADMLFAALKQGVEP